MTSKTINDYSAWAGPYVTTDHVLAYRAGEAVGSRDAKVQLNQFVTLTGTQTLSNKTFATITCTGVASFGDVLTPTGGVAAAGGFSVPTVYHSGGLQPPTTTTGTDTTPVTTETYIAEVFVHANCTLTGISVLNGSAVAGNIKIGLANSAGVLVAQGTSTAASGTAAYQQLPFTATYAAKGPAKYFILLQCNNTGYRFRSHALGNFGAAKKTGEVFDTFTAITPPTTFTTGLGPIADTY